MEDSPFASLDPLDQIETVHQRDLFNHNQTANGDCAPGKFVQIHLRLVGDTINLLPFLFSFLFFSFAFAKFEFDNRSSSNNNSNNTKNDIKKKQTANIIALANDDHQYLNPK